MSENKKLIIIGSDKPVIGTKEMYTISSVNDWLDLLKPIKNPLEVSKTHWEVMIHTKTGWRKGGSDKEGQTVPFTFGQKSLLHRGIKIIARQAEDYAELIVHPQRAKEPKITKVELLDVNYKAIPKGKKLSYKDTIIARAYCVEMFEMNIAFTLWEDDAQGEGHNPTVNALNRINPVPVLSRVNEKGIAEVVFRLPFYTMAVLIANTRTAAGDKSEGATHEYYVTADVVSKHIQKASPNVNVVNPTHNPEPPRQRQWPKGHTPSPTKLDSEKPKPQSDSSKFPVTTGGKNSDDPQGKILSAEFVDNNGNRLHSSKIGTTVRIKIVAKEMKDKKVKVKIWEEDNIKWANDLIFEKDCILIGDNNYINHVQLTNPMFDKAKDGGTDSSRQDYFIEIIHHDTSVTSEVIPVSADAEPTKVESGRSATMVKEPKQEKKEEKKNTTKCYCYLQSVVDTPCNGKGNAVTDKHFESLAKDIGVEAKVFKAVAIVESGGRKSFLNVNGEQKAKILYERHYMYRFLKKIKTQEELNNLKKNTPDLVHNIGTYKDKNASYGSEKEQFEKLKKAKEIDSDSAIKSCSWGKFQVMGKYYNYLYTSPIEMEKAMNMCEVQHFAYFKVYLKDVTGASMIKAMKEKNWDKIAELYNGPDYEINKYHTKMKNQYEKL
ncbi:N-acetylmuramidase domain-containing protein [Chryseobacterium sp. CBSDS_008]|uniref:N-acetylmuramidase domain-containing protein n=1 Tax=Chryseobacterium sp. CBSDS_008 TaxID=3415265 RepID=UPI003CF4AA67